jgi:hypothetical protein
MANNDVFSPFTLVDQVISKALRTAADVVEGVIFSHHAAPTVCAEFNSVSH